MIRLRLTVTTEAPLVLRSSHGGPEFRPPLRHVPGTAVRGALAMEYLRRGGRASDNHFQALFLTDGVSYGPLFPCQDGKCARPLPASAVACKRYGWKHPSSVGDFLLRTEMVNILLESAPYGSADPLAPLQDCEECPDCRSKYPGHLANLRDKIEGYYLEDPFEGVTARTRVLTGVGMSRLTGTAARGFLFSMGAIEEGQTFQGEVRLDGQVGHLQALLAELAPPGGVLRLGSARSRGQGRVRVQSWTPAESAIDPPLERRWEALNEAVRDLCSRYGVPMPEVEYFTLGAESPLILHDACLRQVSPAAIDAQVLGLPSGVERRRVMIKEVIVRGWNAAWGLPKEAMSGADAGSVFLFRTPPSLRTAIQDTLRQLEDHGAGDRRNEGFGRLIACNPFHCRT